MRRSFFFFNDTATTEIYTLSLHDALPISSAMVRIGAKQMSVPSMILHQSSRVLLLNTFVSRSEEHTSELQSLRHLVCRLLLEKKNALSASLPALDQTHVEAFDANINSHQV